MDNGTFSEGVRPGGLTSSTEIRILLCYLLDHVGTPVSREQIEESLLGESLVNYFAMADSLAQLCSQGLLRCEDSMYTVTDEGRTVGRTLAANVPRTIRDAAVRGVIRAQQYAAKAAAHRSEVVKSVDGKSRHVRCSIGDDTGSLLLLELYMPDELSAEAVRDKFIQSGDEVYKLVLASLTGNRELAQKALAGIEEFSED